MEYGLMGHDSAVHELLAQEEKIAESLIPAIC